MSSSLSCVTVRPPVAHQAGSPVCPHLSLIPLGPLACLNSQNTAYHRANNWTSLFSWFIKEQVKICQDKLY